LSANITKAGGKVPPDKIVERDHLQTLLGKSRSALNQDPLSWGAEHLGINLSPLNLNDPGSVSDRVQAATLIARRTGTTPRPLMQDEVAASQQILNHGTFRTRLGWRSGCRSWGRLALPAAEQLTSIPPISTSSGLRRTATAASRRRASTRS
jgi:hypothetical protein